MTKTPNHATLPVLIEGREVPIDAPIAEVVRLINVAGFVTVGSCQTGGSWTGRDLACVSFVDMDECQRFIRFGHRIGIDVEELAIGAWVEGDMVIGEIDFSLDEVPELVEKLRAATAPER